MRESQDSGPPTLRPRSVLLPRDQPRSLQGPVKNVGPCSKTKNVKKATAEYQTSCGLF